METPQAPGLPGSRLRWFARCEGILGTRWNSSLPTRVPQGVSFDSGRRTTPALLRRSASAEGRFGGFSHGGLAFPAFVFQLEMREVDRGRRSHRGSPGTESRRVQRGDSSKTEGFIPFGSLPPGVIRTEESGELPRLTHRLTTRVWLHQLLRPARTAPRRNSCFVP